MQRNIPIRIPSDFICFLCLFGGEKNHWQHQNDKKQLWNMSFLLHSYLVLLKHNHSKYIVWSHIHFLREFVHSRVYFDGDNIHFRNIEWFLCTVQWLCRVFDQNGGWTVLCSRESCEWRRLVYLCHGINKPYFEK